MADSSRHGLKVGAAIIGSCLVLSFIVATHNSSPAVDGEDASTLVGMPPSRAASQVKPMQAPLTRRTLLTGAGAAAAGFALQPLAPALAEAKTKEPVKDGSTKKVFKQFYGPWNGNFGCAFFGGSRMQGSNRCTTGPFETPKMILLSSFPGAQDVGMMLCFIAAVALAAMGTMKLFRRRQVLTSAEPMLG